MYKILKEKLKTLSQKPGIYIFKDASGRIIYIGKAQNLKKRVQSHFAKNNFFSAQFIDKAADLDWIITRNEKEPFLLEDQLIKKYQPRHNIQWRDDKSYFWVKFTADEWPRVQVVHKNKLNSPQPSLKIREGVPPLILRGGWEELNSQLIGPFTNGRELRKVLRSLRKIFPYRTCKNSFNKPCLQWHLGLCPAHNKAGILQIAYRKSQNQYLNSLTALSQLLRLYAGEKIRIEAYDISNIQGVYASGSMIVFYGNKPSKADYRKFRIKTVAGANDVAMIKEVLSRRLAHKEWPYPDLMLIDGGLAQLNSAKQVTTDYKLQTNLIALAKREEEIYTEYSGRTLHLKQLPQSLRLVFQAIRNEAHRFAIFYYRYLHDQAVKIRRIRQRRIKKIAPGKNRG